MQLICVWKHSYCRWQRVRSPICDNISESNAIHQSVPETGESADCSQMERGDKGHQCSIGGILEKINVSPKGYLLLNNKHALRKMKANEYE